jgi:hypothetical protein
MGILEDIFSQARANPEDGIPVTLVTNQPGGEVSYAAGLFSFSPGHMASPRLPIMLPDRLVGPANGLAYLFSDRMSLLQEPPSTGPTFGHSNPFSVDRADRLGVIISSGSFGGGFVANFTLLSWGNAHFQVPLSDQSDNVATGMGPGVGANSPGAYYVFSFGDLIRPPG